MRDIDHGQSEWYNYWIKIVRMPFENNTVSSSELKGHLSLTDSLLRKARIGLWAIEIVDGEEPRMYADATMCGLLSIEEGLPPEAVYHAWYDNIHPDHYDEVSVAVEKMISGEHAEVQYPWMDPKRGEVYVRCGGIRNMDFKKGVRIEGCHQDVSEMYHYQKQVHDAELKTTFLKQIITALPAPTFIKSVDDSKYELCNRSFAALLGRAPEDVIGKDYFDFFPEDVVKKYIDDDNDTISRNGEIMYFPGRVSGLVADTRLWDKWQCCVSGSDGKQYIVGSLWDITEFRRAIESKESFLSSVSHDLRTPLNAVIGFTQLLKAGVQNEEERRGYLDNIVFSAEALLDLVNDLLDYSKLEADKMVFVPEECVFDDIVDGVIRALSIKATSKSVDLRYDRSGGIPVVDVDSLRIRQLLFNIIGNAVKFTHCGEIVVTAGFVKSDASVGRLTFQVRDTGIGIAENDLERIFLPFEQSGAASGKTGTGLGLAICKHLAIAMGGDITVVSEIGVGSTFKVELNGIPYHGKEEKLAASNRNDAGKITLSEAACSCRLLLVDDVPMNLLVLKSMLKKLGVIDVSTAGGGMEALEMLKNDPTRYDAVLTDIRMPGMGGEQLLEEIRKQDDLSYVQVYAVTADVEIRNSNSKCVFNGVLTKPLTMDTIVPTLESIGENRHG